MNFSDAQSINGRKALLLFRGKENNISNIHQTFFVRKNIGCYLISQLVITPKTFAVRNEKSKTNNSTFIEKTFFVEAIKLLPGVRNNTRYDH